MLTMMTRVRFAVLILLSALPLVLVAQNPANPRQENASTKALEVNGNTAPNGVIQVNGRAYADVLALAQATGATVSVRPDRIILTMPNANIANANQAQTAQANAQAPQGFSQEFARNAIGLLGDLREWRNPVATAIRFGVSEGPSLEQWMQQYRDQADKSLHITAVSASTPADKSALQLLQNEFSRMAEWDNAATQDRRSFNGAKAVDPNSLANDPLLAKITECDRFLNRMISSGTFSDNGSCR